MQGVLVRVLQRIRIYLYRGRERCGGQAGEAALIIAEGRNRIAESKELFFRKSGNRGGIPPCCPQLSVCEGIFLINLGDVNCSSSESE